MNDVRTKTWSVAAIAGLGMAAIWLCLAGIVGAIKVGGEVDSDVATGGIEPDASGLQIPDGGIEPDASGLLLPEATDGTGGFQPGTPTDAATGGDPAAGVDPGTTPAPNTGGSSQAPANPATGGTATTQPGSPATTTAPATTAPPAQAAKGDRTGVTASAVKIGIHAPETLAGAPVGLADDPIKGIEGYADFINQNGGVNGRMLDITIEDDRYETSGGADAARRMIEAKNFVISGTLGVDQINVVANEAAKAGVPYHAAGGDERGFAKLGVYQLQTSYDTHVIQLARFLAQDPTYKGKKVGISALNSGLIKAGADIFKQEAARVGVEVVETVYIEKPTDQSSYTAEIQRLKDAGTEVFVPLQDPVTTSRMVNECIAALCTWRYTFSNYAHDSDVSLTLFGGEWTRQKVRGLSSICYYLSQTAYDPANCGAMNKAHDQWVAVYGEDDWRENGQGGAAGYQIVAMLAEGLRRAGPDLTRERYVAAIRSLANYDNLVSSPITFAGKETFSHGAEKMVVYEAGAGDKYTQLTPGFVSF